VETPRDAYRRTDGMSDPILIPDLDTIETGLLRHAEELDYLVLDEVVHRQRRLPIARVQFAPLDLMDYLDALNDEEDTEEEPEDSEDEGEDLKENDGEDEETNIDPNDLTGNVNELFRHIYNEEKKQVLKFKDLVFPQLEKIGGQVDGYIMTAIDSSMNIVKD